MKLLVFLTLSLLYLSSNCRYLPYQSHSFNELDYLAQQLVKGVDSFKIDVNSVGYDSCREYSTWKDSKFKCNINGRHLQCCLGLKGDGSSGHIQNDYFNTSAEVITMFNNPRYDFIWKRDKRLPVYNKTIYLAMNFQFSYVEGHLTKEFLVGLVKAIEDRNLDVKLILGNHWVLEYYYNQCQAKKRFCDDEIRRVLKFPWILQGAGYVERDPPFASKTNFNIQFPNLREFCEKGFPNYGDPTPYFFYEIVHEEDANWITDTFLSKDCKTLTSKNDLKAFRITGNIDQESVENYLNPINPFASLKDTNFALVETFKADESIILSYYDLTSKTTIVQLRSLSDLNTMPIISQTQLSSGPFTKMSFRAPYLLLTADGVTNIYKVQTDSGLTLISQFEVSKKVLASDFVIYKDEVYLVQAEVQGKCQADSISFSIVNLNTKIEHPSQCSNNIKAFKLDQIQSASLAISLDSSDNLQGLLFVSAEFVNFGQKKNAIYAFSFATGLSEFNVMKTMTITIPSDVIDFGVDPNVKIINNNGKLFVLEGHSNGMVQAGTAINTGNIYKCGVSNTKNPHTAFLQNVKYSLSYNWGRLEDFIKRIQSGRFVDSCDNQIMHGKFYNGERPNGIVYKEKGTGDLRALFVSQYVNYKDLPFGAKLLYGATKNRNSEGYKQTFIGNNFDVLDYELFEHL